jgi:hypothetical protein
MKETTESGYLGIPRLFYAYCIRPYCVAEAQCNRKDLANLNIVSQLRNVVCYDSPEQDSLGVLSRG